LEGFTLLETRGGSEGYGGDVFLEGEGRYSPILTYNEWASRIFAAAGVMTALWSPFPNGVLLD